MNEKPRLSPTLISENFEPLDSSELYESTEVALSLLLEINLLPRDQQRKLLRSMPWKRKLVLLKTYLCFLSLFQDQQ